MVALVGRGYIRAWPRNVQSNADHDPARSNVNYDPPFAFIRTVPHPARSNVNYGPAFAFIPTAPVQCDRTWITRVVVSARRVLIPVVRAAVDVAPYTPGLSVARLAT